MTKNHLRVNDWNVNFDADLKANASISTFDLRVDE